MQTHIELPIEEEVLIEELGLLGLEGYNQDGIGLALEREVTRLLQKRGLPAAFAAQINLGHLNAGKPKPTQ